MRLKLLKLAKALDYAVFFLDDYKFNGKYDMYVNILRPFLPTPEDASDQLRVWYHFKKNIFEGEFIGQGRDASFLIDNWDGANPILEFIYATLVVEVKEKAWAEVKEDLIKKHLGRNYGIDI